jgi:acetyl-CoA carboxylase beta subunit
LDLLALVVRDTTGKDLPEGFQTAEFLLEHGFLDFITPRKELKDKINLYIDLIQTIPLDIDLYKIKNSCLLMQTEIFYLRILF